MKNTIYNIVVTSAVALYVANVSADDVQSIINQQIKSDSVSTQYFYDKNDTQVSIQDYIEADRQKSKQVSNQTADIRALSGVSKAL